MVNAGPTTQVSRQVYEALVTRGLDMSIGPQLATKWKAVDENTWYFFLREDVKFSNGQPMTSEDVVFSILRAKQPTSDFKEYISTISSVKAIDKYTIQIKTSKPNPILLNQLSNIFVMSKEWSTENFAVVPQNWDAGQETFSAVNAMGTGPFKITLREPNTKTVFKKNSKWWGDVEHNITELQLLPIKNAATRVAALLSGEIDLVTDAPVQDLNRISSSGGHKVESTPQMRTIFLGMDQAADQLRSGNTGDNPFKKKEVRQALYQAIDIEAIKSKVMRGQSAPAGIITFPGVTGYTAALDKRLPYDVDAAKQLLADAGYPDGFEVELRCPNDRYVNDEAICTAVVGMLGKIGVKVNLFAQTKSKHFQELKDNQGDFYMLGWGVPTLDSHYVFHYLYETGASWNKVNFSNADVDAAIRVMEGEVDLDKRNAAIAKAWQIVRDDISYLPLHHQVISWASKSNVDVPIRPNNEPLFRFSRVN
jgi:peptide/nickel transport system substrate-binding protein